MKMRAHMADYIFKKLIFMKPSAFSLSGASVSESGRGSDAAMFFFRDSRQLLAS